MEEVVAHRDVEEEEEEEKEKNAKKKKDRNGSYQLEQLSLPMQPR